MEGLHFDITGDNSNFIRKLQEVENGVRQTSRQIEESGMSIEELFGRMTRAAAAFGAGFTAKELISNIVQVRGEFQQLEVAFKTMLGSEEKANTLMQQLVKTAAITPFDLQGVANGAKQLLAYGLASDKVNETLIRLGDIAAGLSIPLNDLVYLYGTTMTQGRLFTQDLRQFQGRGIPLADELAKQFGVTKDKVGELVTAGKVGFPEVQKAIEAMTNEGGQFGGLMEAQSKTITGQISNIEDAISTMFNEIGKANEGIINDALSGVSYLVEHWEDVAIAIESAAVAYGTYKASVMTIAALQGAEQTLKVDTEIEGLKSLLDVKEQSKNADLEAAVASGKLTEAKAMELAALREELGIRLTALKLREQEAIAEHESALSAFNTAKQASEAANERLENMDALYQAALAQGDASYEQYALEQLQTASADANTAATALNTAEKNLNAASSKRKAASEAVDTMATQANTVANKTNTASMNIMKLAGIQLTTMLKGMWATLMANPLILVASAVAGLGFAIYKVVTAETEAEKATRMYNEALDEQQKKHDEYKEKIDNLVKAVEDSTKSEGERLQAFEALKAEYPTILNNLLTEAEYLKEIARYKKLIAEEDNNRAKQSDEEILEEARRKLKYYQDVRKRGTSTTLVDMDGNGWASDNVEDAIKAQQEVVNKAIAKVASHDVTPFLENIKNMKDEDIVAVIDGINNSLKALGKSGDDAIAIVTELGGEYSKQQISTIKNALETEQKERSGEKNTGKGWIEQYKKAYLEAKKKYDDFLNTNNELSEIEYEEKLKELKDKKDEAEKKYKKVGGITGSSLTKQENQAGKRLKAQEKLNEDLLALERQNQQDEISILADGTEKKLAQIDLDYKKQEDAIRKRAKELAEANKEAGVTDVNAAGLTTDQQKAIDDANRLNADARKKAESEVYRSEAEAMRDYLKEYGTFQEQKLAIAEEYAEKIRKAQTEGERLSLEKERDAAMLDVDVRAAKQSIDWQSVFGDLGLILKEQIQPTIDNLKRITQSDEFRNSPVESQQRLYDILSQLEQQSGTLGKDMFKDVSRDLELYRNSLNAYHEAQQREIDAANELTSAQERLRDAQENGGNVEEAQKAVDEAKERFNLASESVKALGDKASENAETLRTSSEKARGALEGLAGGLNKLKSGSLSQAFEGVKDIGKTVGGKLGDAIANIDPTGITGGVLAILDILKDGFSSIVVSLQDTLFGAVEGILDDVLSGDIIMKPIQNSLSHVGNILNTLTFGGFNSWFGNGSNAKEVQETTDRLTDSNERLKDSVDSLKEEMSKSGGWKAIDAAKQAKKDQETINSQTMEILKTQMGYHGAHHSNAYYWGLGREDYASLNKTLADFNRKNPLSETKKNSVHSLEDIYKLTPEQMDYIRTYNVEMWEKMLDEGKYDKSEYWENYADLAGELDEITESLKETLTQTSFDSLRDSFIDSLMDMDKSAEDFADDFQNYLMKSILNAKISDLLDDDLKAFYDKWAEYAESDNELSERERNDLESEWQDLINKGLAIRDQVASFTGYGSESDSERTATAKGIAQASQDSVDELNGRFTTIMGHTYSISENMVKLAELQQTHLPFLQNLSYLAPIEENTYYCRRLDGMDTDLRAIKQTLENIELRGITVRP